MLLTLIFSPALGVILGSLFGRILGNGIKFLLPFFIFVSLGLTLIFFFNIITLNTSYYLSLGIWIKSEHMTINWSFCLDSLTCSVLFIVTFVSFLVHIYSIEYMANDPHLIRFLTYLSVFTFFMVLLISSNNFIQMFIGWEGVGLASYLLINFWYTRIQANKAAIKAMLVNRVGDFFILLAFFLIYYLFNSFDYDVIFSLIPFLDTLYIKFFNINLKLIDFLCFFLFFGTIGKSAQLGLHTWLPDAMEGPTPVSALLHAATMVIAGVFLIIKCSFIFEFSPFILNIIMLFGSMTAVFAATTGLFQNDIKKVIAYSTCSQLGYMIFACGLSAYDVSLFHLSNHAFFKALLFLGAGSVIHAISDEQDLRKMGGLKNLLPFSYATFLIGSLALIGFPFLSGFYSKDSILEIAFAKYTNLSHFCYILGTLSAFFTAFYSTRILFLAFLAEPNGLKINILKAHEGNLFLITPLFFLSLFSIAIGFITKDLFIGLGSDFLNQSIFIMYENYLLTDIEFIDLLYKLFPLFFTCLGVFCSYYLYSYNINYLYILKKKKIFLYFYTFFNKKWYFDRIYNQMLTQNLLIISNTYFYQLIDRGFLEIFFANGLISFFFKFFKNLKKIQSGNVSQYLSLFFLFSIISILFGLIID